MGLKHRSITFRVVKISMFRVVGVGVCLKDKIISTNYEGGGIFELIQIGLKLDMDHFYGRVVDNHTLIPVRRRIANSYSLSTKKETCWR